MHFECEATIEILVNDTFVISFSLFSRTREERPLTPASLYTSRKSVPTSGFSQKSIVRDFHRKLIRQN